MSDLTLCVSVWLEPPRRDGSVEVRIVHFRLEIASLEAKGAHTISAALRAAHTKQQFSQSPDLILETLLICRIRFVQMGMFSVHSPLENGK